MFLSSNLPMSENVTNFDIWIVILNFLNCFADINNSFTQPTHDNE